MRNKLQIASTYQQWQEIELQIDEAVANLVNGDSRNAQRLALLVDLMTGEQFAAHDRDTFTFTVRRAVFAQSAEFDDAIEDYLDTVNPLRQQRPRIVKTA